MSQLTVLGLQGLSPVDGRRIAAIDPSVTYVDAVGWFNDEIRETWNAFAVARYLSPGDKGRGTRAERDALLASADIIYGGWPFPLDLGKRATRLKWFHQRNAGASNLLVGDLWDSNVMLTTSRGLGNTLAMAEYTLAGFMHFARGFSWAETERKSGALNHRTYKPMQLQGKTVCIVGAGGIGQEIGRLCVAMGMTVIGTRRSTDAGKPPPGFSRIGGPDELDAFLGISDFVAIACQWTPETTNLFNTRRFAAMKPGVVLANVARGEIIDEAALAQALADDRLRGVVLDVYVGEFERNPPEHLWSDPRVLITPHVSAGSDVARSGSLDLFYHNLQAFIQGQPLENVVDRARGY